MPGTVSGHWNARLRVLGVALGAAAGLNVAIAMLGRGSFLQGMAVAALVVFVAGPAALIGVTALASSYLGRTTQGQVVARAALGVAAVLGSTVASIPAGLAVHHFDVQAAQGYCERLIPRLEEYRREHGSYPTDISELGRLPAPPRLLDEENFYHSDGTTFRFSFLDPTGLLNGYGFDSDVGTWYRWD